MGLSFVPLEDAEREIAQRRAKALASLTQDDKDFINDNFEKRNFYQSESQFIVLFRFNVVGNKAIEKAAKRLVKLELAYYNPNTGYTIPFVPEFYTK